VREISDNAGCKAASHATAKHYNQRHAAEAK